MKFQIGEMSLGDIFDRSLKLLLARLPTFYLINLIVLSPILAVQLLMPMFQGATMQAATQQLGLTFIVLLLTLILQPIATAASLYVISQEFIDEKATASDAFQFAFHRFGRLFWVSLLSGIIIVVGLMMCIIPGIYFLIWYVFVAQVVVVENRKGTAALSRSKQLANPFRGRILNMFLLIGLTLGILSGAVGFAVATVLPAREMVPTQFGQPILMITNYRNYAVELTVETFVNILVQTYLAICATLMYFDIRIRKEGFDLEVAAQKQAGIV